MLNKPFDEITKDDIEALITNEVAESKILEYKQQLHGANNDDKKEFLYDVSSFANASGGDIIYGITEKLDAAGKNTGTPEQANGLSGVNTDETIRRLESSIQDGIAPRIPGVQIKPINGFPNPVLILRIPKSWNSPHMVIFKSASRFYSRNSAGKYPLDVDEIRIAFIASDSLADKIREFRSDRIAKLIADEIPISLEKGSKAILHILPIESFSAGKSVDVIKVAEDNSFLKPIASHQTTRRYNFDGIIKYTPISNESSFSYSQLFRNGVIEAVDAAILSQDYDKKLLEVEVLEKELIKALDSYLKLLKELEVNPPILISLSLVGVLGFTLKHLRSRLAMSKMSAHPIDRDTLILPEVVTNSFEEKASVILRPIFDNLWQSAGFQKSKCYDDEGNWVGLQ